MDARAKRVIPWHMQRSAGEQQAAGVSDWRAIAEGPAPATAPSPKRDRAVLFALAGAQLGAVFTLSPPSALIGGDSDADVHLADKAVSGRHARLTLCDGGASIEDLGSRNGTFVNDRPVVGNCPLMDGDHVRFGESSVVKFWMMDELEEHALTTLFALTLRDPLTRLYNRRYFDDRLYSEFSFARRHRSLLALLLIDIDHFKAVNDTRGHQIGDAVLKLVASSIDRMMRPEDVLARFGGDEFVVIARATSLRNAQILAERICQRIQALTVELPGNDLVITVSAGVAAMDSDAAIASPATLVTAADRALYRAKAAGKNRVVACAVPSDTSPPNDPPLRRTQPPRA